MRRVMLAVATLALFGCSGVSKEQYGAKEAEAAKYKQGMDDAAAKVTALESKVGALEQDNSSLKAKSADLEAQLAQTSAAKSELEVTTAKLTEQSGELKGRQAIRLNEQLLFKENASKLTPESMRTLDAMADAIKQLDDKAVIVAGYTDDAEAAGKSAEARRWQLSTTRALEVAKYLAGRGVNPTLIGVAGFGQGRPAAPNDTLASRALNRRVEVVLTPKEFGMGTVEVKPATLKPQ